MCPSRLLSDLRFSLSTILFRAFVPRPKRKLRLLFVSPVLAIFLVFIQVIGALPPSQDLGRADKAPKAPRETTLSEVRANTTPAVGDPPPSMPVFSTNPTNEEIRRARKNLSYE